MKKILYGILGLLFFVIINGCSRNVEPQLRISNKQSSKVSVKIQTSGSDKYIMNEVEPGKTTEYQVVTEGNITATAVTQNESISFLAAKNTHYSIIVSADQPLSMHVDK
ncbi:MAG: hypothetical protein Q8N83_16050 [Ignavibacteria bacterium]|nr:hypothetical protein [Ignavibacteria bacterium]